jgi:hypothetical protein
VVPAQGASPGAAGGRSRSFTALEETGRGLSAVRLQRGLASIPMPNPARRRAHTARRRCGCIELEQCSRQDRPSIIV